jgi:hypothetical protein
MKELNIFRYIGYNNPEQAYNLLSQAGYTDIQKNKEYVSALLAHYVNQGKDQALKQMMLIHPDREIFLETCQPASIKKIDGVLDPSGEFLSCNGNCAGCQYKSADSGVEEPKLSEKTINLLIIGGSFVLGATLLTLIIVNVRK